MLRLLVASAFASVILSWVPPACSSAAGKAPALHDVLRLICAGSDIAGNACSDARGYPKTVDGEPVFEGQACNVEILALYPIRAEGKAFVIAPYRSGCSGHPDFEGGSLLVSLDAMGKPAKASYWPGKRAGDSWEFSHAKHCIVIERDPRDDRLYCLSYYRSTGEAETWLVRFAIRKARLVSDSPAFAAGSVATKAGYVDRGVNMLQCDKAGGQPTYFELSKLAQGPRRRSLRFEVSYADGAAVREACRSDQIWPMKDSEGKPMVGFAKISVTDIRRENMIFDAETDLVAQERQ